MTFSISNVFTISLENDKLTLWQEGIQFYEVVGTPPNGYNIPIVTGAALVIKERIITQIAREWPEQICVLKRINTGFIRLHRRIAKIPRGVNL